MAGGKPLNGRELRSPFVPRSRMLTFVPPQIKILTSTAHALAPSGGSSGDYVSSSLVSTDLASSLNRSRIHRSNGGDVNKKTLYYKPWNRRFSVRYNPNPSMRAVSSGQFNSRFHSFQLRPIMPRITAQLFGFPLTACSPDVWIPFRAWTRVSPTPA